MKLRHVNVAIVPQSSYEAIVDLEFQGGYRYPPAAIKIILACENFKINNP